MDGSRRRRGRDVNIPRRRVAATPRLPHGYSAETRRGGAAPATTILTGCSEVRTRSTLLYLEGNVRLPPRETPVDAVSVHTTTTSSPSSGRRPFFSPAAAIVVILMMTPAARRISQARATSARALHHDRWPEAPLSLSLAGDAASPRRACFVSPGSATAASRQAPCPRRLAASRPRRLAGLRDRSVSPRRDSSVAACLVAARRAGFAYPAPRAGDAALPRSRTTGIAASRRRRRAPRHRDARRRHVSKARETARPPRRRRRRRAVSPASLREPASAAPARRPPCRPRGPGLRDPCRAAWRASWRSPRASWPPQGSLEISSTAAAARPRRAREQQSRRAPVSRAHHDAPPHAGENESIVARAAQTPLRWP